MTPEDTSELDWLAFRYITDELAPAEREAFENQLAVDQAAREAVARAVELLQLVAAAHEPCASPEAVQLSDNARRTNWSISAASMGVGAAACLLIAVACTVWSLSGLPWGGPAPADTDALALASAWSSAREEFSEDEDAWWNGELTRSVAAANETPGEASEAEAALDDLAAAATPSWMLSALGADVGDDGNHETPEN